MVDLQYSDVKPAACAYLRSTRQAPEGSRMVEMYGGEASDNGLAWSAEALDRGAPVVLDNQTLVSEVTSDCRWLDIRVVPVNGQVSMTWRDVTERHHTAERLAASEEKFRLLADNASDVAEKVRRRCAEPHRHGGVTYRPLVSIGVTLLRRGEDADDLIARADRAMYRAKEAGGNCVVPAP